MKQKMTAQGFWLALLYGCIGVLFLGYSYTQVDLGLTLSKTNIWLPIQQWFQQIGYFNRPLSTVIFIALITTLFLLYGYSLVLAYKNKVTPKDVWIVIGSITLATVLSYPAFSYDFFNYLFTAKTVLVYHKNPYDVIPLQFVGVDSWLSFLHWTHQPSAYTPLWIALTLPPFLLGFGYFLLLIWNLKIGIAIAYILTVIGIGKILRKEDNPKWMVGIVAFALNPLIIVECLVSPHNDIAMMALAIWAIVLYQQKKRWWSWILLSLSVALKLMTLTLIPAFFSGWKRRIALLCISLGFIAVLFEREVLSWYWVWIMPFVALVPDLVPLLVISTGVSMGLLLRYAPFLYYGHWNDPVPTIKLWVTAVPILVSICVALLLTVLRLQKKNKTTR